MFSGETIPEVKQPEEAQLINLGLISGTSQFDEKNLIP